MCIRDRAGGELPGHALRGLAHDGERLLGVLAVGGLAREHHRVRALPHLKPTHRIASFFIFRGSSRAGNGKGAHNTTPERPTKGTNHITPFVFTGPPAPVTARVHTTPERPTKVTNHITPFVFTGPPAPVTARMHTTPERPTKVTNHITPFVFLRVLLRR
eukprot:3749642-Pyramimonas_sp.AAC.1